LNEVRTIVLMIFLDIHFDQIDRAFKEIVHLFHGEAHARRNGRWVEAYRGTGKSGTYMCLMHDMGYIQSLDNDAGTGAK
jgi:hypothetical protein